MAIAWSGDSCGGTTIAMSGSRATAAAIDFAASSSPACGSFAASRNEPLMPAPKPSAIVS